MTADPTPPTPNAQQCSFDYGTEEKNVDIMCRPDTDCCLKTSESRRTCFCCKCGRRTDRRCPAHLNCSYYTLGSEMCCFYCDRRCAVPTTDKQPFSSEENV